jgi:hypothetical protein
MKWQNYVESSLSNFVNVFVVLILDTNTSTSPKTEEILYFQVANFANLPKQKGMFIESMPITIGGHDFHVRIYPGGVKRKELSSGDVCIALRTSTRLPSLHVICSISCMIGINKWIEIWEEGIVIFSPSVSCVGKPTVFKYPQPDNICLSTRE